MRRYVLVTLAPWAVSWLLAAGLLAGEPATVSETAAKNLSASFRLTIAEEAGIDRHGEPDQVIRLASPSQRAFRPSRRSRFDASTVRPARRFTDRVE